MQGFDIWLIALSLAMDCFAVSIAIGIILKRMDWRVMLRTAVAFGLFQMVMTFLGWSCGSFFSSLIRDVDHWIAFGLLMIIGGNMSRMKLSSGGKHFSLRAIWSTVVGETGDSLIFFPIAFAGLIPPPELLKLMALQIVLKTLYEVIVLPVTIRVVKTIKKIEKIDTYDENISYNILRIKDI